MAKARAILIALSALLVIAAVLAVRSGTIPLGVPGEWEWQRVRFASSPRDLALGGLGIVFYAAFVGMVFRALSRPAGWARECFSIGGLLAAAVAIQVVIQSCAPQGYGLAKWGIVLLDKGSTGYFLVARTEARDLAAFLKNYPDWIRHGDALHIGTHPPGLIASEAGLLRFFDAQPDAARLIDDHLPDSVHQGFQLFQGRPPLTRTDRAALGSTGLFTLLACAGTMVPLYLLARASYPAPVAWAAASLWPVVPSAILFQPTADTAFPFLSTWALALAAIGVKGGGVREAAFLIAAGIVLGLGMQFTMAYLAIGFMVALLLLTSPERWSKRSLLRIGTVGIGFVGTTGIVWALTGASPITIWSANLSNHARFYVEYPRSYLAWLLANPVELAVSIGLPVTLWALIGLTARQRVPKVSFIALLTLSLLTLSGKNLSEVARLWLPIMPALLVAAGRGLERLNAGPSTLAMTVGLIGLQTLAFQTLIQVVYPV